MNGKLAATLFLSTALLSSTTFAQDATSFDWTGFYAGLNAGAVNHTMDITDTNAAYFNSTIQQVSNPQLTAGFQVGYRRQINPSSISGIYGAEFSTNFANASFSKQYGSPYALYQLNSKNELQTICLLELLGGVTVERTFLFLDAGLSWSNISGKTTNQSGIPFSNSFNTSEQIVGTAFGGGIEYAFTNKVSARFKLDVITPKNYTTTDNVGNSYEISNSIVQSTIGINYKFA